MALDNPYEWNGHRPQVIVPRSGLLDRALRQIFRGNAFLLGGRGMPRRRPASAATVLLPELEVARSPWVHRA